MKHGKRQDVGMYIEGRGTSKKVDMEVIVKVEEGRKHSCTDRLVMVREGEERVDEETRARGRWCEGKRAHRRRHLLD